MGKLGGAILGASGLGAIGAGGSLGGSGLEGEPDGAGGVVGSRVVACAGAVFDTDKQFIFTDDGGDTWTAAEGAGTQPLRGIAYSAFQELFVAIGTNGECQVSDDGGENWTLETTIDATSDWRSIAYDITADLWCAVGSSGTNRAMTSATALSASWTGRVSADEAEIWQALGFDTDSEMLYAGVGFDVNRAMDSANGGITWALGTAIGNGSCDMIAISPDDGRIAWVSESAGDIVSTDDGGATYDHALGVFAIAKRAFAVNDDGSIWFTSDAVDGFTSPNGVTGWVANSGDGADIQVCVFDPLAQRFIGLGDMDDAFTSTDGVVWASGIELPTGADGVRWRAMAVGAVP